MPIEDLLIDKNKTLHTIGPDETLKAAVTMLASNDVGALPVCDAGGKMVGILSERDIVRTLNQPDADIGIMKISEIMKTNVIYYRDYERKAHSSCAYNQGWRACCDVQCSRPVYIFAGSHPGAARHDDTGV
jgi:predicted transcriptional regulator